MNARCVPTRSLISRRCSRTQQQTGMNYASAAATAVMLPRLQFYNRYVAQVGETQARTFSAPPGHSEHQSGLAVDLSSADQTCWLEICFRDTPAGQWLAENFYHYGFVLRYPEGKEAITGFQFEPWHFRYVDKDLATALYQSGLTLEEAQPYLREAQRMVAERKAS